MATDPPKAAVRIPNKLHFRIGELASLLDVEPHVLRYWEQEFRVRPARSPSGQRMYSKRDIERFLRIRTLLYDEGYTIAGARKALGKGPVGVEGDSTQASPGTVPRSVDAARCREALAMLRTAKGRLNRTRGALVRPLLPDADDDAI